ncbi:MAG: Guanine nucleotide binding protein (G protein), beta polypeptide 1-like [Vezdaea aestivalis]|nr:MAG: Guanine nucleotide binding protein (G protein), beta polypeptide 1-like [Vezdaea aestivalis]
MATPTYLLRGHASDISALAFTWQNRVLISSDTDGFVIAWSVAHWRPLAVWKAHDKALIALAPLTPLLLLTHGRDGKLKLWNLSVLGAGELSVTTPIAEPQEQRQTPPLITEWLVNTLNFCGFAHLPLLQAENSAGGSDFTKWEGQIAVPSGIDPEAVSVITYPTPTRPMTIKPPAASKKGMVMAVTLFKSSMTLYLAAAYESGSIVLFHTPSLAFLSEISIHSQPPLSILFNPSTTTLHTSAADSLLTTTSLPSPPGTHLKPVLVDTKHAGQDSLRLRSDRKLLATAGWDGMARVYDAETLAELAVLKWHKGGVRSLAFAEVMGEDEVRAGVASVNRIAFGEGDQEKGTEVVEKKSQIGRRMVGIEDRQMKTYVKHWIAVGGKDGKISLWDIY